MTQKYPNVFFKSVLTLRVRYGSMTMRGLYPRFNRQEAAYG